MFPIINFLPDKENEQNVEGLRVMSLLRKLARQYNAHYLNLISQIQKIPNIFYNNLKNVQDDSNKMGVINFDKSRLLSFRIEDLED